MAVYEFESLTGTGSGEGQVPDGGVRLGRNYPNPFNPSTTITFEIPARSHVNLSIYDIQGRPVRTVTDRVMPEGPQEVVWDGRDELGKGVSSGVYFCRLTALDRTLTRKMVLIR
jgi:flagellar hook assembly protein FlgD